MQTTDCRSPCIRRYALTILSFSATATSMALASALPAAHADANCDLGDQIVRQEAHHVGTYRVATCAMVADLVLTHADDCADAVSAYVTSRGYPPAVANAVASHTC